MVGTVEVLAELHRKGELALQRRAERQPLAARGLMTLAEIHRCQGDFAAAIEVYEQVAAARRGDWRKAAWLCAMLRQEPLPFAPPSGMWPAPFARIENFLSQAERERMHAIALSLAPRFVEARVGSGDRRRVDVSRRRGLAIDGVGCAALSDLLVPRVRALLPSIGRRLRLSPGPHGIGGVDLMVYGRDGFVAAHRDTEPGPWPQTTLAGVYFFHRQPQAFKGGDLLLYDMDVEAGTSSRPAFSRIEPTSNSLVLIPMSCLHAVVRVTTGSDALADARLSACFSVFDEDSERRQGAARPEH